jgi:hypothetical protein
MMENQVAGNKEVISEQCRFYDIYLMNKDLIKSNFLKY